MNKINKLKYISRIARVCDCLNKHFNKTNYHQIRRREKRDTHKTRGQRGAKDGRKQREKEGERGGERKKRG